MGKSLPKRDLRLLETTVQQCHTLGAAMPWQLCSYVLLLIKEVQDSRKEEEQRLLDKKQGRVK